ncbi:MAG: type II toxin-antitoxin system HicB family antitoxin [Synergistaceae bacterium]|nr:type II toxin-antitoxin system HicB family antitoxin [Synergistaceae bacterium]
MNFTACYTKLDDCYMGQLLEWTNIITDGKTIDECREMLIDAAREVALSYADEGKKIPTPSNVVVESISIPLENIAIANAS